MDRAAGRRHQKGGREGGEEGGSAAFFFFFLHQIFKICKLHFANIPETLIFPQAPCSSLRECAVFPARPYSPEVIPSSCPPASLDLCPPAGCSLGPGAPPAALSARMSIETLLRRPASWNGKHSNNREHVVSGRAGPLGHQGREVSDPGTRAYAKPRAVPASRAAREAGQGAKIRARAAARESVVGSEINYRIINMREGPGSCRRHPNCSPPLVHLS